MADTQPKTVPPDSANKSTGNASQTGIENDVNETLPKKVPTAEPKTETGVPPDTNSTAKSAGNVSEVPKAGPEPKNEKDVSPNSAPKSTGNTSEAPKAGTEPKTEPKSTVNTTKVPMDGTESKTETDTNTPKSTVKVSQIKTVQVSNISKAVTKKDIWEFFTFSGDIHYIEMKSDSETTQLAFVTFKDSQGADTAVLLTGATIADLSVAVSLVENYQLPPDAPPLKEETTDPNADRTREAVQKAEEVVSTMLAKGFVLGKDALQKAKSFDEKHQFTTNASAKVADLDRKMGLSQKLKEVNERYQVSEKTQSAIAVAEQKANTIMSNPYVSSWVSGAFAAITKATEGVGSKTKEKVDKEEKERSNLNAVNKEEKESSNSNSNTVKNGDGSSVVKDAPVKSSNEDKKLPDH